jgi:hypothetical protein
MEEQLVENGAAIGWSLVGLLALLGLGVIQLFRRRGDVKKAREAYRLAHLSVNEPRPGPIAVTGVYREDQSERWIDHGGQHIAIDGELQVEAGTRARWKAGTRTYMMRNRDEVLAIGVMSKDSGGWRLAHSAGERGVQLFAAKPRPAPKPLFPWRAPLFLVLCGGIAFGGLYGAGTTLVDVKCSDATRMRLELAAAVPLVRDQAMAELARCKR